MQCQFNVRPDSFMVQGISGLLPQLKSITRRVHLSQHAGKTAAVDAYSLLHKGSYGCAQELVEGIPTTKCVPRSSAVVSDHVVPEQCSDAGLSLIIMAPRSCITPGIITGTWSTVCRAWHSCRRPASPLFSSSTEDAFPTSRTRNAHDRGVGG